MAALDFPDAPTPGQIYDKWTWNGSAWILTATAVSAPGTSWLSGNGSPETIVTANVGSLYSRLDGSINNTLYRKETGSGNTGWRVVTSGTWF